MGHHKKTTTEIGNMGEDLAVEMLESKGYIIEKRNWRFKKAEIDIICRHDNILIFVEVKTRSYDYYGSPEAFINKRKQRLIQDAASQYMLSIGYDWEIRFDVVSIILSKYGNHRIYHYEDAFFGGI